MTNQVKELLEKQINVGQELLEKSSEISSQETYESLKLEVIDWADVCNSLIKKHFTEEYANFQKGINPWLTVYSKDPQKNFIYLRDTIKKKLENLELIHKKLDIYFPENINLQKESIKNEATANLISYEYDVALSFAGEDRDIVEQVATYLKNNGVSVFYDDFEQVNLWGKDLAVHLYNVYRKKAKYCIPFISAHYKQKVWTKHEFRSALERALQENSEYFLPVRLDDTEIEGLRNTIGYIDFNKYTPKQLGDMIMQKLSQTKD